MAELHYFPLLAGDWLAGEAVSMMTPEQEGAFIHLLCYAWQSSGVPCSLPNDDATLAHLSRLGKRWAKVGTFVKAQFDVMEDDPTRLRNAKLWDVFQDANAKHQRRVRAGQTGGIAKAERKQTASNSLAMLEQSSSSTASNALAKASNQNQSQSQNQKEEPKRRAVLPGWVGTGVARWIPLVGQMTPARFYKALGPVVSIHGWDVVWPDLLRWVETRKTQGKPCKLEWYSDEASARITRVSPPIVDEWGVPTEYGEKLTRPDVVVGR